MRGDEPIALGGMRQRAVLALLVVHANEVVSAGRLIEGVWGEAPPETAQTALQGHVSRLRRLLGSGTISTQAPGYVLHADPGAVDVGRVHARLETGRAALAAGDARGARRDLDEALALWRGAPLADLDDAPFAAAVARELEELRVAALEERFDAMLRIGRHGELVAELEALVARDPLRERPRAQLMLALYRCGRQAEAIEVYEAGRRLLADELGLAPGEGLQALHRDILRQAPDLGPAPRARAGAKPRRRRGRLLAASGAVALAAGVIAGAAATGPGADAPALRGSGVVRIDTRDARIAATTALDGTPTSIAAAGGRAWVLDADGQTIAQVARSGRPRTFATGTSPVDLAAADSGLWVGGGRASNRTQFSGPLISAVAHVPAGATAVRRSVTLPAATGQNASSRQHDRIAATARAIWVVAGDGDLVRIDPLSHEVVRVLHLGAVAVAADAGGAWVLTRDATLIPVTERDTRSGIPIDLPVTDGDSVAIGGGAVWVSDPAAGALWRVVPGETPVVDRVPVGAGAGAVAYADGAVWVAVAGRGVVARVDPDAGRVSDRIDVGGTPRDIAAAGDSLWVSVASRSSPLADACGPLQSAGGDVDAVLVSDLPLRSGPNSPVPAMAEAVAAVVRRRGYRAGRHRVGLRSCDDSTSQSGTFDRAKCRANARAYAADPRVVAVVGPYNSPCAQNQIPIAAAAPDGPLAMVSPSTSVVGALLRGRRGYARLVAADDGHAMAAAAALRRLGRRRVFVLEDGEGYGGDLAAFFGVAARAASLEIIGRGRFSTRGAAAPLLRRIRRTRADAVYVAGILDHGAGRAVRDLRTALPQGVTIIGGEGLLPPSALFAHAGRGARGVLITTIFPPVDALPARGRRFAAQLARDLRVTRVHPVAVYAAQAADVALDAIARSDGGRASVAAALSRTQLPDAWVGPIRFTPAGDLRAAPVAVLRAVRAGGSRQNLSTDGAELVSVERTPARVSTRPSP